jgi:hypothetical protein
MNKLSTALMLIPFSRTEKQIGNVLSILRFTYPHEIRSFTIWLANNHWLSPETDFFENTCEAQRNSKYRKIKNSEIPLYVDSMFTPGSRSTIQMHVQLKLNWKECLQISPFKIWGSSSIYASVIKTINKNYTAWWNLSLSVCKTVCNLESFLSKNKNENFSTHQHYTNYVNFNIQGRNE